LIFSPSLSSFGFSSSLVGFSSFLTFSSFGASLVTSAGAASCFFSDFFGSALTAAGASTFGAAAFSSLASFVFLASTAASVIALDAGDSSPFSGSSLIAISYFS
jgi:hypothetical protein